MKTGGNYISTDGNIVRADTILVGVNAASNGMKLSEFSIHVKRDNSLNDSTYYDETINTAPANDNYVKDFLIIIENHAGKEEFTFRITDGANQYSEQQFTLTVL